VTLAEHVAKRIRELRLGANGGGGLSQEELARGIEVAPNTVSRWETGTYKPSVQDLDAVARFLGISILEFFPESAKEPSPEVAALLRAAKQLPPGDVAELRRFADFKRAERLYKAKVNRRKGSTLSD